MLSLLYFSSMVVAVLTAAAHPTPLGTRQITDGIIPLRNYGVSCPDLPTGQDIQWFTSALCSLATMDYLWFDSSVVADAEGVYPNVAPGATFYLYGWTDNIINDYPTPVYVSNETALAYAANMGESGDPWWPYGFMVALESIGYPGQSDSGLLNGTPVIGLSMVSGYQATDLSPVTTSSDDIFQNIDSYASPMTMTDVYGTTSSFAPLGGTSFDELQIVAYDWTDGYEELYISTLIDEIAAINYIAGLPAPLTP